MLLQLFMARLSRLATLFLSIAFGALAPAQVAVASGPPDAAIKEKIAALNVPFVPNRGQWDSRAAFAAQTIAGTVFVTTDGEMVYKLRGKKLDSKNRAEHPVLTESLVDARQKSLIARPAGFRPQDSKVSYFIGNDASRHQQSLPTYERVNLGEMYPGINVHLRATGSNIEKIFTVAPKQNPAQISMQIGGAARLSLNTSGELIATTPQGDIAFTAPIAFQEDAVGEREDVAVAYALNAAENRYSFTLGAYDDSRPLVIDPLISSVYLGGSLDDIIQAIAVSPTDGQIFVCGETLSTDFPANVGQVTHGADSGNSDAFVARYSSTLAAIGVTYFGGDGLDKARAMVLFGGVVYITGETTSTALPLTAGSPQPTPPIVGTHGFVARFSQALALTRSSYVGGNGNNTRLRGIVGTTGAIYVVGTTNATDLLGTATGAQNAHAGGDDAFVSMFDTNLTAVTRTTYFGGTSGEVATSIVLHPASGDVVIAGGSSSATLPGSGSGAHSAPAGGADGMVARFSGDLTTLRRSTFFGGTAFDQFLAVGVHPLSGDIYAAGFTDSTNLPAAEVAGAAQPSAAGGRDAMLVRFSADLTSVRRATYFGASSAGTTDQGSSLAFVPSTGDVIMGGNTNGNDLLNTAGGIVPAVGAGVDGFVARFSADLGTVLQATYLGASVGNVTSLALSPVTGSLLVAGFTTDTGAFTGTHSGARDAFVARMTPDLTLLDRTPDPFAFAPVYNAPRSTVVRSLGALISGISANIPVSISGQPGAQYCISSTVDCTCNLLVMTSAASSVLNTGQYLCLSSASSASPNQTTVATVRVGAATADFEISTGSAQSANCSMDLDGNGVVEATTDGLLMTRALFGLTGTAVTNGAIGANATRTTWAQIQTFLNTRCGGNF